MTDQALDFTEAQQELIDTLDSTYVVACPGAGKTQTIVQRFIDRPGADSRRGVGLLSFTNVAVDEARSRCAANPRLLESPNFVGTIDSFINRFVISPNFHKQTGKVPTFRSSWAIVPGSTVTVKNVRARASLDWFEINLSGAARLDIQRIPGDLRYTIAALQEYEVGKLETEASARWKAYIDRGILNAEASRLHLHQYLGDPPVKKWLKEILRSRFVEIIVDEVQDCSKEDVELLGLVADAGVRVVMVGDPDQAIYTFRGSSTKGLESLVVRAQQGSRLNGNFRSSPAICSVVDSLRSGADSDNPIGKHADIETPVQLVKYQRPIGLRAKVAQIIEHVGMRKEEVVFLAHSASKARGCAGGKTVGKSTNRLVQFANTVHVIQDEGLPGAQRAEALRMLCKLIRELSETEGLTHEQYLSQRGITDRTFREACLRLAMSLSAPYEGAPSVFKANLARRVESQRLLGWALRGVVTPSGDAWPSRPSSGADGYLHSTIHGYKGLQYPGVVLVVPEKRTGAGGDDGVSQWTSELAGEARRVLYVGASRAERLLVLAAHESVYDEVRSNLERDGAIYVEAD